MGLVAFRECQMALSVNAGDGSTHLVGQVVCVYESLGNARSPQLFSPVEKQQSASEFNKAFGRGVGQRAEPRAKATRQEECLSFSMSAFHPRSELAEIWNLIT